MTKKGTHRIIPPAKRIQVIIGELAGLLAIITLVVECASYLQDRFTLNLEDSAQNTMVAVMDKQLELQSEIATFQASGVKSGPTASAAAQEMASLVGTLQVLETERRGPKATLTLNAPTTVPLATPTPKPTKISQPAPMPTCSAVVGPFAAVWQSVEVVVGCASSSLSERAL